MPAQTIAKAASSNNMLCSVGKVSGGLLHIWPVTTHIPQCHYMQDMALTATRTRLAREMPPVLLSVWKEQNPTILSLTIIYSTVVFK
jgi:hypothetical protein